MPTRYHELVIEGPRQYTLGFIIGFLAGRGTTGAVIDAEEEGFDCESFREKVRELLDRSVETLHLLVPAEHVAAVREAAALAATPAASLKIQADREVKSARFAFKFTIYSREHGERIHDFFAELPEGVTLTTEEGFREEVHGEGAEMGVYAPVHQYALSARGTIEGDFEGVLRLHRLCRAEDLIETWPAELIE